MESQGLLDQVKHDIESNELLRKGDAVVVGVSGGADSVCLLKVLKELQHQFQLTIYAVHVNHGLRGAEADEDQRYVESICKEWEIPLKIFRADVRALSLKNRISLEEAGRETRYRLLNEVLRQTGSRFIAVAHQQEDQAETIMLHLLRGSGLDGLCGMSLKQDSIIRPLLNVPRKEILEFLHENRIAYCTDSSNLGSDYTRNRIRNVLFPRITEMFTVNPVNQLVRLSEIVQEERDFLEETSKAAYYAVSMNETETVEISIQALKTYHRAIIKRIIRHAWERINESKKNLEQGHVNQILSLVFEGRTGKRINLPRGIEARVSYDRLIFSRLPEKAEEGFSYSVKLSGATEAKKAGGTLLASILPTGEAFLHYGAPKNIKENSLVQLFDYDKLREGIFLRSRQPGDRVRPYGPGGEKKLKEFFIDQKIPREKRLTAPLVARDNRIVWIIGMRTSQEFRADQGTRTVLVLEWRCLQE